MRSRSLVISLVTISIVLFCFAAREASSGTVKGQITDSEGAAIKGAHLLFHLDPSGRTKPAMSADIVRETDATGHFDLQLEPGFYDVCVMATAFTPECRKILLTKEGDIQHDVHLNADPLVIKHLGDQF